VWDKFRLKVNVLVFAVWVTASNSEANLYLHIRLRKSYLYFITLEEEYSNLLLWLWVLNCLITRTRWENIIRVVTVMLWHILCDGTLIMWHYCNIIYFMTYIIIWCLQKKNFTITLITWTRREHNLLWLFLCDNIVFFWHYCDVICAFNHFFNVRKELKCHISHLKSNLILLQTSSQESISPTCLRKAFTRKDPNSAKNRHVISVFCSIGIFTRKSSS